MTTGGQHDDRAGLAGKSPLMRADLSCGGQAVEDGHLHVHQHQIERLADEGFDRLTTVADRDELNAHLGQDQFDDLTVDRMVFRQKRFQIALLQKRSVRDRGGRGRLGERKFRFEPRAPSPRTAWAVNSTPIARTRSTQIDSPRPDPP